MGIPGEHSVLWLCVTTSTPSTTQGLPAPRGLISGSNAAIMDVFTGPKDYLLPGKNSQFSAAPGPGNGCLMARHATRNLSAVAGIVTAT
jgi:hypothetical protein